MDKPTIVFDVDNVIINSIETCINAFIELNIDNLHNFRVPKVEECFKFNMTDLMPDLREGELQAIFESKYFFDNAVLIDGMEILINKLYNEGYKIIFASAGTPKNIGNKAEFLKSRFPFCQLLLFCDDWGSSFSKKYMNMDLDDETFIFLDDQTRYLKASNAKYRIRFSQFTDGRDEEREWCSGWEGMHCNNTFDLECMIKMITIVEEEETI